ncbi:hypothetical protein GJ496_008612 [Pomphorhynchus laevis]|nr:hypothetical protein GJ496_008612 [Pomphorhynchus laevis]
MTDSVNSGELSTGELDSEIKNPSLYSEDVEIEPTEYREQWVMKGLPAWAHGGLPNGWTKATHGSGLPIYVHSETKTICLSKPYRLGSADLKSHRIPTCAIPCLYYHSICKDNSISSCQSVTSTKEGKYDHNPAGKDSTEFEIPKPFTISEVATFNVKKGCSNSLKAFEFGSLSEGQLRSYCQRKFDFELISLPYFANFASKCKFLKNKRLKRELTDSTPQSDLKRSKANNETLTFLPLVSTRDDTTTCPLEDGELTSSLDITMSSTLQQLHTLCSTVLNQPLTYELDVNPRDINNRFKVYVKINNELISESTGRSKKIAKIYAANKALQVLKQRRITHPTLHCQSLNLEDFSTRELESSSEITDISITKQLEGSMCDGITNDTLDAFSSYTINSDSIYELSLSLSSPTPYKILRSIVSLDFFHFCSPIKEQVHTKSKTTHVSLECKRYNMTDAHSPAIQHRDGFNISTYVAESTSFINKEDALSRAAQNIIGQMFPRLQFWSEVLLMVQNMEAMCTCSAYVPQARTDTIFENRSETSLINSSFHNDINWTLINEIRTELRKISKKVK